MRVESREPHPQMLCMCENVETGPEEGDAHRVFSDGVNIVHRPVSVGV